MRVGSLKRDLYSLKRDLHSQLVMSVGSLLMWARSKGSISFKWALQSLKETYILSNEPCIPSMQTYILSKETYILSKEPYILSKETYILSNEPCILSKEPTHYTSALHYILSKESYILSKEPYMLLEGPRNSQTSARCEIFCMQWLYRWLLRNSV